MKSITEFLKESANGKPGYGICPVDDSSQVRGIKPELLWLVDDIIRGIVRGWILGDDGERYAFTEENYVSIFVDDDSKVREQDVENVMDWLRKKGKVKFRFKTNAEAKKEDPELKFV